MNTQTINERIKAATEREATRNHLYSILIQAEITASLTKQAAIDAEYAVRIARENLEDFEQDIE